MTTAEGLKQKHKEGIARRLFPISSSEKYYKCWECKLNKKLVPSGSLWLFENHLCFYSTFLSNETKVFLRGDSITKIDPNNSNTSFLLESISPSTNEKTTSKYTKFSNRAERDECVQYIKRITKLDARLSQSESQSESQQSRPHSQSQSQTMGNGPLSAANTSNNNTNPHSNHSRSQSNGNVVSAELNESPPIIMHSKNNSNKRHSNSGSSHGSGHATTDTDGHNNSSGNKQKHVSLQRPSEKISSNHINRRDSTSPLLTSSGSSTTNPSRYLQPSTNNESILHVRRNSFGSSNTSATTVPNFALNRTLDYLPAQKVHGITNTSHLLANTANTAAGTANVNNHGGMHANLLTTPSAVEGGSDSNEDDSVEKMIHKNAANAAMVANNNGDTENQQTSGGVNSALQFPDNEYFGSIENIENTNVLHRTRSLSDSELSEDKKLTKSKSKSWGPKKMLQKGVKSVFHKSKSDNKGDSKHDNGKRHSSAANIAVNAGYDYSKQSPNIRSIFQDSEENKMERSQSQIHNNGLSNASMADEKDKTKTNNNNSAGNDADKEKKSEKKKYGQSAKFMDESYANSEVKLLGMEKLKFEPLLENDFWTTPMEFFDAMFCKSFVEGMHADRGSEKLVVGDWKLDEEYISVPNQPKIYLRKSEFVSKIKDPPPFMPAKTEVFESARVRFYGSKCCILDMTVSTPNIKYGDYFFMVHKYECIADEKNPKKCHFKGSMAFDWVKSTMFRRIIVSKARSETVEGLTKWMEKASLMFPNPSIPKMDNSQSNNSNNNSIGGNRKSAVGHRRKMNPSVLDWIAHEPTAKEKIWKHKIKPWIEIFIDIIKLLFDMQTWKQLFNIIRNINNNNNNSNSNNSGHMNNNNISFKHIMLILVFLFVLFCLWNIVWLFIWLLYQQSLYNAMHEQNEILHDMSDIIRQFHSAMNLNMNNMGIVSDDNAADVSASL